MNPLPPQAYTKETLGKAFAWLQSQPENIKEFATSPDILVSLYLKAKLNGESALERPSIQNFKNELRSLAGLMGEFEVMEPTAATEAMVGVAATRAQMEQQVAQKTAAPKPSYQAQPIAAPQPSLVNTGHSVYGSLDAKSRSTILEVKDSFNLSTETEALRLLIATGHKSLQKLSQ